MRLGIKDRGLSGVEIERSRSSECVRNADLGWKGEGEGVCAMR